MSLATEEGPELNGVVPVPLGSPGFLLRCLLQVCVTLVPCCESNGVLGSESTWWGIVSSVGGPYFVVRVCLISRVGSGVEQRSFIVLGDFLGGSSMEFVVVCSCSVVCAESFGFRFCSLLQSSLLHTSFSLF